jgi:hypothetical protein
MRRGYMKVTDRTATHCPVEVTLAVIGGKWKQVAPVGCTRCHIGQMRLFALVQGSFTDLANVEGADCHTERR